MGPGRLQGRELYVLRLKSHLKRVFPVNFGEVIINLDRRTHFIGRQKRVASKRLQAIDSKSWQAAVFSYLGNPLYLISVWNTHLIADWAESGSVQIIQTSASIVD